MVVRDIPAGTYIMTTTINDAENGPLINLFEYNEENNKHRVSICCVLPSRPCMFSLIDGQLLDISFNPAIAYKTTLEW